MLQNSEIVFLAVVSQISWHHENIHVENCHATELSSLVPEDTVLLEVRQYDHLQQLLG